MKKFLIGLCLLLTFTTVNASEHEINLNKEKASLGEEVVISLDSYSDDIKLNYDKNVFTTIDKDNFKNVKNITSKGKTFYIDEENNLQIKLKVKKNAPNGNTTIKVSYGNKKISKDIKIDGKVNKESSNLWIIYIILSIILVGFIIYYYNRNKKELNKLKVIVISAIGGITLVLLIMAIISLTNSKEVKINKDNITYLIKIRDKNTINDELSNSSDVTELEEKNTNKTASTKDTTNENLGLTDIVYNVKLNSYTTNTKITKKGEDIVLTFSIDITPYVDIKAVEINGQIYSVKKLGDNYQAVIKASNIYGDGDYTITSVILSNGKTVSVENKHITIYVLKEEPKIENIEINSKEAIPVLSFNVKDPDNSFVKGEVSIKEVATKAVIKPISLFRKINDPTTNYILEPTNVKVGLNTFELPSLTEGMGYDLSITLEYDLDEDKTDNKYSDTKEEQKTETFEREYNFELKNAKITSPVTKDDDLKLSFENGAFSYKDIEEITIDGKTYQVTKDASTGIYTVTGAIDKCNEKGKCKLYISNVKVTTENDSEKVIPCDYYIDYTYLKDEPIINSFNATYNQKEITGTFDITDIDSAISEGKLIINGPDGEKIIKLTKDELKEQSVTKPLDLETAGEYTVTLEITYIGTSNDSTKNLESTSKIEKNITASITDVYANPEIIIRGENVDLIYTIKDNTEEDVTSITVDNGTEISYPATKQSDGIYKVTVPVPQEGQNLTRKFKATKINYSDKTIELAKSKDITLNVMKNRPEISTFTLKAAGGQISGEFTITDDENAVVGAKYTIGDKTRNLTIEEFKNKKFTEEDVKSAGNYDVILTLIYDLGDGNKLEDITNKQQVKVEVDATITESSINPKFVKKGENVTITYTIKDNTPSKLSKIIINNNEITDINLLENDKYEVTIAIDESESAGEKEFKATKLIYADQEEFELENTVFATVLKTEPTIENFTATYDDETNKLTGNISVTAPDQNTITGGKLTITGPGFSEAKEISLTAEELLAGTFTEENLELPKMGDYIVSLEITYNLGEKDITTQPMKTTINKALEITSVTVTSPQTVTKNGKIELIYTIKDNTDEKINKFIINDLEKDAIYNEETDTYKVEYTAPNIAGNQKYTTTKIIYETSGTKEVTVEAKDVYVLKDIPVIDSEPNYTDQEATVKINDSDKAKTKAQMIFTKDGIETKIDLTFDELSTIGTADIHELSNGIYDVTVDVDYDLDGEDLDLPETKNKVTKEYKNISIITNYDSVAVKSFTLNNFVNTDKIMFDFTVDNDTSATIKEVKIGEKWYTVDQTGENNNYNVTVDNPKERKELQITELKFSTEITKTVTDTPKVLVNKTAPTANITVSENESNKVTANISIKDDDTTITEGKKYAVLKFVDDTIEEIERKEITDNNSITFDAVLEGGKRYQVDVIADYDLIDGQEYREDVIGSSEHITINAKVELKTFELSNQYTHTSNKYFTLKFNFESNVKLDGDIKDVVVHTEEYNDNLEGEGHYTQVGIPNTDTTINNVKCEDSVKDSNGNYTTLCKADYVVPDKSGVIKLKPVSFTYLNSDKTVIDTEFANTQEKLVDIIKWAPKFTYTTENDWDNKTVKVKINVDDKDGMLQKFSTTDSYFQATFATKTSKTKIDSLTGEQTIIFDNLDDLKPNTPYRVMIKAYFDQYHGDIVNKNENRLEAVTVISYVHYITIKNEASLNDLELVTVDGNDIGTENKFRLGDDIRLSFAINDDGATHPGFVPTKIKIEANNPINPNYKKEYTIIKQGNRYITAESLQDLNLGEQTIKIIEISNNKESINVTKDNIINFTILETDISSKKISNNISTFTASEVITNNEIAIMPTPEEESNEEDKETDDSNNNEEESTKNVISSESTQSYDEEIPIKREIEENKDINEDIPEETNNNVESFIEE